MAAPATPPALTLPVGGSGPRNDRIRADFGTAREPAIRPASDRRDSDENLIRRIGGGDQLALGDLYDRYAGLVYSVTKRILKDTGAVEEVRQDTFLHLWHVAARFDSTRGTLGRWLAVMARHRSIDRLRRTAVVGEEVAANHLESALNIEIVVASNEKAERVRAALRTLPDTQRMAMELAYFEGLTQSEVAKRMGIPLGTVKTRVRTALASLKRILAHQANPHYGERSEL